MNRVSNSSIEIIVNLAYTGGGDITYIHVSFREIGTSEWIRIEDRHANSMSEMTWKAFVEDDRFVGIGIEFLVAVKNGNGHSSEPITLKEPLGKRTSTAYMYMQLDGKGSSHRLLFGNGRIS